MNPIQVDYCKVCGLPKEYCEFGPSPAECLKVNGPMTSATADNNTPTTIENTTTTSTTTTSGGDNAEKKLQELKIADDSQEDHTTTTASSDATAPAAATAPGKKKKEVKHEVIIETTKRNKKKHVTTISGLENYGVKLSDASKHMAKKFSCGCSVVKTATGGEEIDIQGDFQDELIEMILEKWTTVPESDIYLIVEKKKVKAVR
eukprot:gene9178-11251_t